MENDYEKIKELKESYNYIKGQYEFLSNELKPYYFHLK
jgi:hypothetical protein